MAQPANHPKIEELRARLRADPKSRLFFPLAEELRKNAQLDEAEQVLRTGLGNHPSYLSAWVSLGRVLRDEKKNREAIEPLLKALQLDPGNVVAARLLADVYLGLGDKVEAIKKYKLVNALLPAADEELKGIIEQIQRDLNPVRPSSVAPLPQVDSSTADGREPAPSIPRTMETAFPMDSTFPGKGPTGTLIQPGRQPRATDAVVAPPTSWQTEESPWQDVSPSSEDTPELLAEDDRLDRTGDQGPMLPDQVESPFQEPTAALGYSADAFAVESPSGMHIEEVPMEPPLEGRRRPLANSAAAFLGDSPTVSMDERSVPGRPAELPGAAGLAEILSSFSSPRVENKMAPPKEPVPNPPAAVEEAILSLWAEPEVEPALEVESTPALELESTAEEESESTSQRIQTVELDTASPWEEDEPSAEPALPFQDDVQESQPEVANVFAPVVEPPPPPPPPSPAPAPPPPVPERPSTRMADLSATIAMAELYAQQGLSGEARAMYEHILQRQPDNSVVREKLAALVAPPAATVRSSRKTNPKVLKLQNWLAKIARRGERRV